MRRFMILGTIALGGCCGVDSRELALDAARSSPHREPWQQARIDLGPTLAPIRVQTEVTDADCPNSVQGYPGWIVCGCERSDVCAPDGFKVHLKKNGQSVYVYTDKNGIPCFEGRSDAEAPDPRPILDTLGYPSQVSIETYRSPHHPDVFHFSVVAEKDGRAFRIEVTKPGAGAWKVVEVREFRIGLVTIRRS